MEMGLPNDTQFIWRARALIAAATVLIVGLIPAAALGIWILYQDAVAETEDESNRLGVVLAEQTERSIQGVDLLLEQMADRIVRSDPGDPHSLHAKFGGKDVHDELAARLVNLPQAEAFAILDSFGNVVNSSRAWPAPQYSRAEQSYFQHFADRPDSRPYVSAPSISPISHMPVVFLARRITSAEGRFLGVLVAPIRLNYFNSLLTKSGLSNGSYITLIRNDGLILMHFPPVDLQAVPRMPAHLQWYSVVAAGGGHYHSPGAFPEIGRTFVSVHPISTYSIVIDVTRSEAAALAPWRRESAAIGFGTVLVAIALISLLWALSRQIVVIERSGRRIGQQVAAIRLSEDLLLTTLQHMNQGLLMVDPNGRVAIANKQVLDLLDLPADMMATNPPVTDIINYQIQRGEFSVPSERPIDIEILLDCHAVYERRRPNGTVLEVRTAPLPGGGFVRTYTDVTARAAAEEMLGLAASHDQLTGLANRQGFHTRLDAAIAASHRGNADLAVLCLDLDRFKPVNDALGHDAGDQLLILVAQRMVDVSRASDVIGRLGGDEFAIVLHGSTLAGAEAACRRLLEAIRMPYVLGGQSIRIGVSIGVATYPADGGTAEQLLRNADVALYKAKAAGRNTWCVYASEDGQRGHQRMTLELDFRTAVETQQFTLAYQAICDSGTGDPVAFEALLRWVHPTRGPISPAEFIPIAEQTGLIIPLGRWVLEAACAEAATWAVPLRIAVNLSPAQFRDRDLPAFISDVLQRTSLKPTRLDIEVTEGLLLEDVENVVETMQYLRGLGVRMVLDDFGTAHSSLSYLRGFPFDVVKIDRSFLRALSTDRQARALVEAMLAMARALGLEVVGEGVETQEQLALLRHLQCRLVQGYLLGRPAPSEQTRELIWRLAGQTARGGKSLHVTMPA